MNGLYKKYRAKNLAKTKRTPFKTKSQKLFPHDDSIPEQLQKTKGHEDFPVATMPAEIPQPEAILSRGSMDSRRFEQKCSVSVKWGTPRFVAKGKRPCAKAKRLLLRLNRSEFRNALMMNGLNDSSLRISAVKAKGTLFKDKHCECSMSHFPKN